MSDAILVRRVSVEEATSNPLGKGYILEFLVEDAYILNVNLLTDKDPTMVSTDSIIISSQNFYRNAEIDEDSGNVVEDSIETVEYFAARAFEEAQEWALEEIERQGDNEKLVDALAEILPPPIEK
jgi:hypothetical protein